MAVLRLVPILLLALLAACGPRPAPPALPPPAPAPALPAPAQVWTREAGVRLRGDSAGAPLPYLFMRLDVLRADSAGFTVRCAFCARPTTGWVAREAVVHPPALAPADAAGGETADFLLAVRQAALRRDVAALREVMARNFVHDLNGRDGVVEAVGDWQAEAFRRLDRLPFLLDRGVAAVPRTEVWAAPPEYALQPAYPGLRAGFQLRDGRWWWIFLAQPR